MAYDDIQMARQHLADRIVKRAERIDGCVAQALRTPDPIAYVNVLISSALDRLLLIPQTLPEKWQARAEILEIRRAILLEIAITQNQKSHRS
jgi:hypothetical protein